MMLFGFILLIFGFLIILQPALLAYIVAFFFIFIGTLLVSSAYSFSYFQKKSQTNAQK